MPKNESRFAAWRTRQLNRLVRSGRVFLFGLIVACGIEVVVDWNQTFWEINVLRDHTRQKGVIYAGLLSKVVVEPMMLGHSAGLERLAGAILDDADVIYVQITNLDGKVVYDRMDRVFAKVYEKRGKGSFRHHYAHWLERDSRGVVTDPEGFKQRLANSRYRDLPQIWADATARVLATFSEHEPLDNTSKVVYQDRLRDENRRRDDTVTWAVAPLEHNGKKVGAVLVAFDMTRINREASSKYLKGFGMVVFFVGLIVVQNINNRRDKLRLLELEARHKSEPRLKALSREDLSAGD